MNRTSSKTRRQYSNKNGRHSSCYNYSTSSLNRNSSDFERRRETHEWNRRNLAKTNNWRTSVIRSYKLIFHQTNRKFSSYIKTKTSYRNKYRQKRTDNSLSPYELLYGRGYSFNKKSTKGVTISE